MYRRAIASQISVKLGTHHDRWLVFPVEHQVKKSIEFIKHMCSYSSTWILCMEHFLYTPFDVDKLSIFQWEFSLRTSPPKFAFRLKKNSHVTESLPDFFQQLGLKSWLKPLNYVVFPRFLPSSNYSNPIIHPQKTNGWNLKTNPLESLEKETNLT